MQDNLLPTSCQGQDWQGGLALTLVDVLDTLLVRGRPLSPASLLLPLPSLSGAPRPQMMNRRADMQQAVELLRRHLSFDKDVKVHVFETIIRVLGGLTSGHVLIEREPFLVPGYDGLLLRLVRAGQGARCSISRQP